MADERGVVVLDDLPGWALLPEDAGRWQTPADDVVDLEHLAPWDVPPEHVAAGQHTGPPGELPPDPLVTEPPTTESLSREPLATEPLPTAPPATERSDEGAHHARPPGAGSLDAGLPGPGLPDGRPSVGARAPWESLAGIEDVAPDGMLALVLEQVDRTTLDERGLVEAVAAWERIAAWAHLNSALVAAELSRRAAMNPLWEAPAPANTNVAGDELAMRLAWSRKAAGRLVRDGRALENELLLAAEAVRDGRLDTMRLRVLTDRLHDRPGELAWAVQERVLPAAAMRTPAQLGADIDRALLDVDPLDAADRLARAVAQRHVCHPRRLPDGMAGIWAVVPAADAAYVDATLEATARAARALGDPRNLDQLRADTFVDTLTGRALLAGAAGAAAVATPTVGDVLTPMPGESGASVRTPGNASHPAPDDGGTSPAGGSAPDDRHRGAPDDNASTPPTAPPRGSPAIRLPKVRVNVTVALSTLMGLDDRPAELAGFGPISATQARALAAGGVWRRLVTDPLSGRVLDVGRTRYRPPKPLAEHVVTRDGVCDAPGCSTPAHRCDLDHTTEYRGTPANGAPTNGTTSADNLGPLSARCHRLKTDGGFVLTQPQPGVFEWRTPAGLRYRVVPGEHGRVERLGTRGDAARDGAASGDMTPGGVASRHRPNPGYPDQPPF